MKVPSQNMGELRKHFRTLQEIWLKEMKDNPMQSSFLYGKIAGVTAVLMNFNMVSDETEVKLDMLIKAYPDMHYTLD